jgi:hypothetical protein
VIVDNVMAFSQKSRDVPLPLNLYALFLLLIIPTMTDVRFYAMCSPILTGT